MKNLQQATERICELKGNQVALNALLPALIELITEGLGPSARARLQQAHEANAEVARTVLLHADISDLVLASFEREVTRHRALLKG